MAWKRRHPGLAMGGLVALTLLVSAAAYQGGWYVWARSHFRAAQEDTERHDWREAHEHLQACLSRWPNSPAVHLLMARVARRLELLHEAEEHLEACQRLQGQETQGTKVEGALLRLYRGDLASVQDFLLVCVKQDDPEAVEILDILSAALILKYRVAEAQHYLDDLLRRQPDHFHGLVRRGWTARNLNMLPEAVTYYEKALALRPDTDAVRLALAEIQVALGRFAEAQEHFEQLQKRQPENPSILFGLGRCLSGYGQREQALELFDRVLARYPNDWKALGERGWLAVQLDRPAEAESYLRRAFSLAPPDLPILMRLSECLRLLGKHDEARSYREQADRLNADFQRADQLGDLIREKSPNDPALRHELACILLRLGKSADAQHWFHSALEKDPKHRPTHQSLVDFYEKAGDFGRAAYHRRVLDEQK